MKKFIYDNYNLKIKKIYYDNFKYYFFINNIKVEIIKIKNEELINIDKINIAVLELLESGFPISSFLINKNGSLYTKKGKCYIVLMKNNYISSTNINLNDIIKIIKQKNIKYSIIENYCKTIDEIELLMIEYNKEYPCIKRFINYVIGVSENAITLLNKYKSNININESYICFDIDYADEYSYQVINPFNIIYRDKTYNTSVYIKKSFYDGKLDYNDIYKLNEIYTEKIDKILLFCNLLFCEEYFSLIRKVILSKYNENIFEKYINRIDDYNSLLNEIKMILNIEEEIYFLTNY